MLFGCIGYVSLFCFVIITDYYTYYSDKHQGDRFRIAFIYKRDDNKNPSASKGICEEIKVMSSDLNEISGVIQETREILDTCQNTKINNSDKIAEEKLEEDNHDDDGELIHLIDNEATNQFLSDGIENIQHDRQEDIEQSLEQLQYDLRSNKSQENNSIDDLSVLLDAFRSKEKTREDRDITYQNHINYLFYCFLLGLTFLTSN